MAERRGRPPKSSQAKKKEVSLEEALEVLEQHGYQHFTPIKLPPSLESVSQPTQQEQEGAVLDRGFKGSMTITLRCSHTINGNMYGPGSVSVSRRIAPLLLEQDQRAIRADQRLLNHEPHAFLITRQVYTDGKQAVIGLPIPVEELNSFNPEKIKPFAEFSGRRSME